MYKIVTILLILLVGNSFAANNNPKTIFERAKKKIELKNTEMIINLVTTDGKGNSKSKTLDISFAEFPEFNKIMVVFTAPENVAGTKILTTDYPQKRDIIEIYFPATGKIQKIKANQHNMKMMGSEIPINQWSTDINDDYSFTFLEDTLLNNVQCYRIKIAKKKEREYGVLFISKEKEELLRVEKFSLSDKLISITEMTHYKKLADNNNRLYPSEIRVTNLKTKRKSVMAVKSIKSLTDIKIEDFTLKK